MTKIQNQKKYKAVIFDFDGVVGDTMEDNFKAWQKTFQDFGVKIKREDYFPLEGHSTLEIAIIISKKFGKDISTEELSDKKHHYYSQNNNFKLYLGVRKIIELLKNKRVPTALVTGADRRRLESFIPKLLEGFEVVVAGGEVEKGKPEPDAYLKAIERLSLKPKDCLVVENAPLGIQSAKSAGCDCVALTTTVNEKILHEADKIIHTFNDLYDFLKSHL